MPLTPILPGSRVRRLASLAVLAAPLVLVLGLVLVARGSAGATQRRSNPTPFPDSTAIVGARWTSPRHAPPHNQYGDILPTIWADDGKQYTMVDDGGVDIKPGAGLWRNSMARITGSPPAIGFTHVGDPNSPPPHTFAQIQKQPGLWEGPLGTYYSSGLVEARGVFFATAQRPWDSKADTSFTGLEGIVHSTDRGRHWITGRKRFPAPLGNLSWVVRGRGGYSPDGYVYAIATEREFNASRLILGRSRPGVAQMTNPASWQWASGPSSDTGRRRPAFSRTFRRSVPIISWRRHITYPQMAYDSPIHRYLLTFTYSYVNSEPGIWRNGAELVILEAPRPWGPFSFVAAQRDFGPSNGYAPGFPIKWISRDGRTLWMKWTANFDGCAPHLDCSGGYGFNYRRLRLTLGRGR